MGCNGVYPQPFGYSKRNMIKPVDLGGYIFSRTKMPSYMGCLSVLVQRHDDVME